MMYGLLYLVDRSRVTCKLVLWVIRLSSRISRETYRLGASIQVTRMTGYSVDQAHKCLVRNGYFAAKAV